MQHASQQGGDTSPLYRGFTLKEFRDLLGQSRKEELKDLIQDCIDREAYEHAEVVRENLQNRSFDDKQERSCPREAGEISEHITNAFSIKEQIQVAYSVLDNVFREIRVDRPRISEWVNCTLTQIEAVIDSFKHDEVPRE
jgi:hypothetical protein